MKKGIIIGCIVLALAALAWFGGRKLFGAKEADTEVAEAEISADVSSSDVEIKEAETSPEDEEALPDDEETADEAEELSADAKVKQTDAETVEESDGAEEAAEDEPQDATEEAVLLSDENALYTIKTSAGSNLGMVPIVNGNAVVLMDSGATTYQGEYIPEEQSAYRMKLEEQTSLAASEGKIGAWAFYRESEMRDFAFPEGLHTIEKFAFARSGLTGIVIPEGVTSIGSGAFYHCDSLTSVIIPDSVTVIEENAFSHTPWLENWMAERTAETSEDVEAAGSDTAEDFLIVGDGILLAYRGTKEDPELPPEVKSIVPGVFENIQ